MSTRKKFAGFENIDAGVRSAILISVACSYFAWDLGFEFGVHGTVYFEKVFFVWSISFSMLLIFIVVAVLPIDPDELEHVFDRFYRCRGRNDGSQEGSGLGLSIAKRALDLHGADLACESRVGEGTTFRFALSCAAAT